ncbi:MAG: hypothetical protein U9N82_05390, partial [Thermodesulfobacteriota bacterium]|nr:hypothetical protein [Thermodesulfobacteriota bacterium]
YMTIQVATKFPVSNFKFPDIAREKSLRGSNILNPKNIILRTICRKSRKSSKFKAESLKVIALR